MEFGPAKVDLRKGPIMSFSGAKKTVFLSKTMARAKQHYIPGYIWHITHRCHKREFLLGFSKDRQRYLQWLYQARRRYGLRVLDYVAMSDHIQLGFVFTTWEAV
jgi:putative transposase